MNEHELKLQKFLAFAAKRYIRLSGKYLDEHGENKGMYERNNILDVLEELADAYNILSLLISRMDNDNDNVIILETHIDELTCIQDLIASYAISLHNIMKELDEDYLIDNVERVVKYEEVV